ncbi:MAG: response regulator transcription factor [Planctomycetota bacterium]
MTTRCMIVDDEPLARKVLQRHIATLPSLELVKQCDNAAEAAAYLHENGVDLIFLDIKMPGMSGMDFLNTLSDAPRVIVTTAYSEYALEGYEHSVIDYLLKPIALDRFVRAVNKAVQGIALLRADDRSTESPGREDYIFLGADKSEHKVRFSSIRYVEGSGNFVKVFTDEKMIRTPETLTAIAGNLPKERFLRIHKSFIVSIDRIDRFQGNTVEVGKDRLPIGKYYKKDVEEFKAAHRLKKEPR